MNTKRMQLAQHNLRISDPGTSLAFYQDIIGMTLLAKRARGSETHYFLGFVEPGSEAAGVEAGLSHWQASCFLVLVHDPECLSADVRKQPDSGEGYWKISISVRDLDVARNRLIANSVQPDAARQVGDIAYLCHFDDPDGYCIELIQHDFLKNHEPEPENPIYRLGTCPSFLLVTYRVKDPLTSLRFYTELLGMRLLSRQVVEAKGFTLYFLACTEESPPHFDVEHVDNREWLWQRPYAMVELQHVWGTEAEKDFAYRVGSESGFDGISFELNYMDEFLEDIKGPAHNIETCEMDPILQTKTATIIDPDGFSIKLIDRSSSA